MYLKIFSSSHKLVVYLDKINPVIQPVGHGKVLFPKNWLSTNVNDNINHKHFSYGELTSQYWIWKNYIKLNLDKDIYIGFSQYRRHWVKQEPIIKKIIHNFFTDRFIKIFIGRLASSRISGYNKRLVNLYNIFSYNSLNIPIELEELKKIILNDNDIDKIIKSNDVILPKAFYLGENIIKHFCGLYSLDEECWKEIISFLPDELSTKFLNYETNQKIISGHNMYIAKPKVLNEYFNFLFNFLEKIENIYNKKTSKKLIDEPRFFCGLSERLADFWFKKYKKCSYLPVYYIKDV
jgi:hypothetical protein